MRAETHSWLTGLRDFQTAQRVKTPLDFGDRAPNERTAERMILAAQLSTWLTGIDDFLAARRAWLAEGCPAGDPHPAIVITTTPEGIGVAESLVEAGSLPARSVRGDMVAATEREYRLWCIAHPDPAYHRHVNIWNWIKTNVPQQRHSEFARYALLAGESYWLHRAGIAGVGSADRRDCHLWRWTGRQAALLEAFVVERSVRRLGDVESD